MEVLEPVHDVILGLDLGTNTGFALMCNGKILQSGTVKLWRAPQPVEQRWVTFWNTVASLLARSIELTGVDPVVAYESVHSHRGTRAAHVYGGLRAVLECVCNDVETLAIPVATWKKLSVGKGNANKDAYIRWASSHFGIRFDSRNEDECAALGVAVAARKMLGLIE